MNFIVLRAMNKRLFLFFYLGLFSFGCQKQYNLEQTIYIHLRRCRDGSYSRSDVTIFPVPKGESFSFNIFLVLLMANNNSPKIIDYCLFVLLLLLLFFNKKLRPAKNGTLLILRKTILCNQNPSTVVLKVALLINGLGLYWDAVLDSSTSVLEACSTHWV